MSEVEDDDDEWPQGDPEGHLKVTPQCCEEVKQNQAVYLALPLSWYDGDKTVSPVWKVRSIDPKTQLNHHCEAKYCPFCGKHLPAIVPVVAPRPVCATNDGYYCTTCKQRLNCCLCLPPERAWGPNVYDPNFGDDHECADCGHPYVRHFDPYEDFEAVGCKYCDCRVFKKKTG